MRVIVASVVPSLKFSLRQALRQVLEREPLFVEPGVKTGMPILYDMPQEVGADRIVNAVAAFDRVGGPCIVVDFGTATTFDVVTARGEYAGRRDRARHLDLGRGALREGGASLARRDPRPDRVVGKTTAGSIQSGLYFGYLSLVDGMIDRIVARDRGQAARHRDRGARRALRRRVRADRGGRSASDAARAAAHR